MVRDCYVDRRYVPLLDKTAWVAKMDYADGSGIESYHDSYDAAKKQVLLWEKGLDKDQNREDYGGTE